MRPNPIEYQLDSWDINFYAETGGREADSLIAVIQWYAVMPVPEKASKVQRTHTVRESAHFDTYEEAIAWVQEMIA
jgi:hypothetical protein